CSTVVRERAEVRIAVVDVAPSAETAGGAAVEVVAVGGDGLCPDACAAVAAAAVVVRDDRVLEVSRGGAGVADAAAGTRRGARVVANGDVRDVEVGRGGVVDTAAPTPAGCGEVGGDG